MSQQRRRVEPAIEMLQLPNGASDADWHDAVTALIETDAYWALFPAQVDRDARRSDGITSSRTGRRAWRARR
jgi:hypothetical protein